MTTGREQRAARVIRELPLDQRPRERLLANGTLLLNNTELLAVLIGTGVPGASSLDIAYEVLQRSGGWDGLRRLETHELEQSYGIGPARAALIKAALEIARRLVVETTGERLQVKAPQDIAGLLQLEIGHLVQEELRVICLDTKNRVQAIDAVYKGNVNSSLIRIGEIFKLAIKLNSVSIIVAHNHPSQELTPSPEDVLVTRQIIDAGKLLDIDVLDHLVICSSGFVSMRERGLGFPARSRS